MSPPVRLACLIVLFVIGSASVSAEEPSASPAFSREQLDQFEKQVRPILVESCQPCHGAQKQEAGLRLDSRAHLLRGSDSGPVFQPKSPQDSLLLQAVRRSGDLKMPPEKPLNEEQIGHLTRWLEGGAAWPAVESGDAKSQGPHWAFQPRQFAAPPQLDSDWPNNDIDSWIGHRLRVAELRPSPPASAGNLIRRLSFDLTGLPPTPDDVERFESEAGPDAYERLADRLLASPSFGERWARHWLDVARYADNKGYVFFEERTFPWAYVYRDYVINALNRDLPYDRFVVEQLAGDLIESDPNQRPLAAMGFLTLGAHFMNNVHDITDDRIDVISRGLMGLTVTCARCHDHKYDPVTQADYYAIYGVLRSCEEPLVAPVAGQPPATEEYAKFTAELATREGKLNEFVQRKHRELVDGGRTRIAEYLMAVHAQRNQPATDDFMLIADTADVNPAMIKRWRSALEKAARVQDPIWIAWHRLAAVEDGKLAEASPEIIKHLLAAAPETIHPRVRQWLETHPAIAEIKQLASMYGEMFTAIDKQWKESVAAATTAGSAMPSAFENRDEEQLRRWLYGPTAPPDVPPVFGWGFLDLLPDRASQGEYQKLLKEVEQWLMTGAGAPPRTTPLVDAATLYDPRIFIRGNPLKLGDAVPRRFLTLFKPDQNPFVHGSGRRELAQEITRSDNPLTARVLVNRFWHWHFGQGLVRTPSDFGLRSQPPSHPELLDGLAERFVSASGWSMKSLHRRMVLSATYRQASTDRDESLAKDPENRLLSRMNPRRLEFEGFRDAMLAAADSLDRRMGGPPVQLLGDAVVPRRTLYGFIDRMDVAPLLTTFDFPNPSVSSPLRESTTVAPQSLYLMNHGFIFEIASRIARRADLPAALDARCEQLFRLVLSRPPSPAERNTALAYLGAQPDENRWAQLVQTLLIANEFLFID